MSLTGTPLFNQLSVSARESMMGAFSLKAIGGVTAKVIQVSNGTAVKDFYADRTGSLLDAPVTGQTLRRWLGGATGYVVTWYDQSGRGNHMSCSSEANRPTVVLDAVDGNFVDFRPDKFLNVSANPANGPVPWSNARPYTVIWHHGTIDAGGLGAVCYSAYDGSVSFGVNEGVYKNIFDGNATVIGSPYGPGDTVTFKWDGADVTSYTNSVTIGTQATSWNQTGSTGQYIGLEFLGSLYSVLMFESALSDAERILVENVAACGPVTDFAASNPTETTVDLTWIAAPRATLYTITSSPPSTTQTTTGTSLTFPDLIMFTEYVFTITPSNIAGDGPVTSTGPIMTLAPVPVQVFVDPPFNVTETTVDLSWTPADPYAVSYNVYSYLGDGTPVGTQTTTGSPVTMYELTPATYYYFAVQGVNSRGDGPGSTPTESIETLVPVPAQVYLDEPFNVTAITVDISWTPLDPYTVSYNVYISLADGTPAGTQPTTGSPFTITELAADTTYYVMVRGVNARGEGPESYTMPFTTLRLVPGQAGPVSENDYTGISETTIGVSWPDLLPDATSYNVYAYNSSDGTLFGSQPADTRTSHIFTGLVPGSEYYFTVAGVNAYGEGQQGGFGGQAFTMIVFTSVSASNPSDTTVDLTWTPSPLSYPFSCQITSDPPTTTQSVTDSPYTFGELAAGTPYTFTFTPVYASPIGDLFGTPLTAGPITTLIPFPERITTVYDPTNITQTTMDLDWLEIDPFTTSFKVYIYSDFTLIDIQTPFGRPHTITGLAPATNYNFTVTGVNYRGEGLPSDPTPTSTTLS